MQKLLTSLSLILCFIFLKADYYEILPDGFSNSYYVDESNIPLDSKGDPQIDDLITTYKNAPEPSDEDGPGKLVICPGEGVACLTKTRRVGNTIYITVTAYKGIGRQNVEIIH